MMVGLFMGVDWLLFSGCGLLLFRVENTTKEWPTCFMLLGCRSHQPAPPACHRPRPHACIVLTRPLMFLRAMPQGSYQLAVEKYAKAVELDPSNEGFRADLQAAEQKLQESQVAGGGPGGLDFSNMGAILNNPEFMEMAQQVVSLTTPRSLSSVNSPCLFSPPPPSSMSQQPSQPTTIPHNLVSSHLYTSIQPLVANLDVATNTTHHHQVMQQPQFAEMVNNIAGNLGQNLQGGMPDFSQMFSNLAAQQPADGSIPEVLQFLTLCSGCPVHFGCLGCAALPLPYALRNHSACCSSALSMPWSSKCSSHFM